MHRFTVLNTLFVMVAYNPQYLKITKPLIICGGMIFADLAAAQATASCGPQGTALHQRSSHFLERCGDSIPRPHRRCEPFHRAAQPSGWQHQRWVSRSHWIFGSSNKQRQVKKQSLTSDLTTSLADIQKNLVPTTASATLLCDETANNRKNRATDHTWSGVDYRFDVFDAHHPMPKRDLSRFPAKMRLSVCHHVF